MVGSTTILPPPWTDIFYEIGAISLDALGGISRLGNSIFTYTFAFTEVVSRKANLVVCRAAARGTDPKAPRDHQPRFQGRGYLCPAGRGGSRTRGLVRSLAIGYPEERGRGDLVQAMIPTETVSAE